MLQSFITAPKAERADRLRWLSMQTAFGYILARVEPYLTASVWYPVFSIAVPSEDPCIMDRNLDNEICELFQGHDVHPR